MEIRPRCAANVPEEAGGQARACVFDIGQLTAQSSCGVSRATPQLIVKWTTKPLPGRRAAIREDVASVPSRACQESHVLLERSAARSDLDKTRRLPREPDRFGTGLTL